MNDIIVIDITIMSKFTNFNEYNDVGFLLIPYPLDSIASASSPLLITSFIINGTNMGTNFLILAIGFPFSNSSPLDFCASIICKVSINITGTNLTEVTNANTKSLGSLNHLNTYSNSSGEVTKKNNDVEHTIDMNLNAICIEYNKL